ncbi:MAG TPA: WhiB family transcriptional regulator [Acidimicrobiia bacterium]
MSVHTLDQWRTRAACRGPETALFFPPTNTERREDRDARERRAKAICGGCPVRRECLQYAIGVGEMHGIWGGMNEAERRAMQEANTFS